MRKVFVKRLLHVAAEATGATFSRRSASFSRIFCERIRDDAGQQPVVVAAVPDVVHLSSRQCSSLLGLPKGVQL